MLQLLRENIKAKRLFFNIFSLKVKILTQCEERECSELTILKFGKLFRIFAEPFKSSKSVKDLKNKPRCCLSQGTWFRLPL